MKLRQLCLHFCGDLGAHIGLYLHRAPAMHVTMASGNVTLCALVGGKEFLLQLGNFVGKRLIFLLKNIDLCRRFSERSECGTPGG